MAVTKIWGIKKTLNKAIEYITDEKKTDGKLLISSNDCTPALADLEMELVRNQWGKNSGNLAFHLTQSFLPNEVNKELAHSIGLELIKNLNLDEHQYILCTHIDKLHIHNHIIFNSVKAADGKRYYDNKNNYKNIQNISDKICKEKGLSIVSNSKKSQVISKHIPPLYTEKKSISLQEMIKQDINSVIKKSNNYEHFIALLISEKGYEIKQGKYTSFKHPNKERFVRDRTLGDEFSKEQIQQKININQLGYDNRPLYSNNFKSTNISWKSIIKNDIYKTIAKSSDYNQFINLMKVENNYEIKQGKFTSFRPPNKERFIRDKTIGMEFTKENIEKMIELKNYGIKIGLYKTYINKSYKKTNYNSKNTKKLSLINKVRKKFIILKKLIGLERYKLEKGQLDKVKYNPREYSHLMNQFMDIKDTLNLLNNLNIKSSNDLITKKDYIYNDIINLNKKQNDIKLALTSKKAKYDLLNTSNSIDDRELKSLNLDTKEKKISFLKDYKKSMIEYKEIQLHISRLRNRLEDLSQIEKKYVEKQKGKTGENKLDDYNYVR